MFRGIKVDLFSHLKCEMKSKLQQQRRAADRRLTDLERRSGCSRVIFCRLPLRCRCCRRSRSQRVGDGRISQAKEWMSPRQHKAEALLGGVSSLISEWAGPLVCWSDLCEVSWHESRPSLHRWNRSRWARQRRSKSVRRIISPNE